jgi:hypothetical protein
LHKRRRTINLDSDEEASEEEEVEEEVRPRHVSITPPPVVDDDHLQQAMKILNDKRGPSTRSLKSNAKSKGNESSEDDFDFAAYKKNMNSDLAKEAKQLYGRGMDAFASVEKPVESTLILLLLGKKVHGERLPSEWEVPLGLKVTADISFLKVRQQFKDKREYDGEVILVWRGTQLLHGTPKAVGMVDKDQIRNRLVYRVG